MELPFPNDGAFLPPRGELIGERAAVASAVVVVVVVVGTGRVLLPVGSELLVYPSTTNNTAVGPGASLAGWAEDS
jgi:hypothetical protein